MTKQFSNLSPFGHVEEGTHYACKAVLESTEGKTCCWCSKHKCVYKTTTHTRGKHADDLSDTELCGCQDTTPQSTKKIG